jgi:hypothetical protein
LPKNPTFDHRLSQVEAKVAWVRAIGAKEAHALLALAAFSKLPKNLTFGHRLSQVEAKVAWVRAIGAKEAHALLALAAFSKLPKNLTFGHRLFVLEREAKVSSLLFHAPLSCIYCFKSSSFFVNT